MIEVPSAPLDELVMPVRCIRVDLDDERKGFAFSMSARARLGMGKTQFHALAQSLGDLVHPHPALLIVLPDGELLTAYKLEVE